MKLGRAFFGESMFSTMTDSSKVALAWLVARLKVGHFTLLDCQFMTTHLASLGARTVSRDQYIGLLSSALSSAGGGGSGCGSARPRRHRPLRISSFVMRSTVTGATPPSTPSRSAAV